MAIPIIFYNNKSEKIKVAKTLTTVTTLQCNLLDETNIVEPSILVQINTLNANYAQISLFNRYYYITKITNVKTGLWRVDLRCDVLMSYSTAIKNQTGVILRNASLYNVYIDDDKFTVQNNRRVQIKEFPNGFSNEINYALVTAGG